MLIVLFKTTEHKAGSALTPC